MKINVTLLFVLMLLSTSATLAQETLSVVNADTSTTANSENVESPNISDKLCEVEVFQSPTREESNNDAAIQRQLQENKIKSQKARAERAQITEALRKRLKKSSQAKASSKAAPSEKQSTQN
ncbi:MAG: hypothetical protein AAFP76_13230 [Bacteroidota bacterium]